MSTLSTPHNNDVSNLPLVLALDLGGTQVRTAVLQGATLHSRVAVLTGENPTPDRLVPRLFQAVEQALDEARVPLHQIAGIGIGAPGPLNPHTGIVSSPPNLPGWHDVPLGDMFHERFDVPIYVENDANAAALGEYLFGAGRGARELVYLTISTGIGGGIISDGKILEGVSGTAGELGHMTIDWHGERCNCGNIGCLEYIASGTAIARQANEAIAAGHGQDLLLFAQSHAVHPSGETHLDINARTVGLAAAAGIPLAREIIARAAEALGVGLVNIIHIFNPELIILGGGVTQIGDMLLDPVRRLVEERTMHVPREDVRIVLAQLGPDVGLVGAGAKVYSYLDSVGKQ